MKKLFTLIIICAVVTPLFAQQFGEAMFKGHEAFSKKGKLNEHKQHKLSGNASAKYLQLKSANANKQKLDSVIVENNDKHVYRYNAAGQLTYMYFIYEDTSFKFKQSYFYNYEYDSQGRLSQIEDYSFYEEDGFKDEQSRKTIYTYQDKNNAEFEEFTWNSEIEALELNYKGSLVFDDAGRVIEETSYDHDDSSEEVVWVYSSRYVTQYHANGEISLGTRYIYDPEGKTWIPSSKDEFAYDDLGNLTQEAYYSWIAEAQTWVSQWKYKYETTYQNNQIKESEFEWINEQWFLNYEEIYNLDADGTPNEAFTIYYNEDVIIEQIKMSLTYNKQYAFADLLLPIDPMDGYSQYDPLLMHNMLTKAGISEYDEEAKTWEYLGEYTFYYSSVDVVNEVNELSSPSVVLYPNPATSSISISGLNDFESMELNLYSAAGAVVLQQTINSQTPLSVAHLNPGMYLYQIKTTDKVLTGKVLID